MSNLTQHANITQRKYELQKELNKMATVLLLEPDNDAFLAGYLAGFMASAEGHNGEYPFRDKNWSPEDVDSWEVVRLQAAIKYIKDNWSPL